MWLTSRRRALSALEVQLAHQQQIQTLKIELALARAARDRAEGDLAYWKARAERFLDQIGMSNAIISAPVMAEPAPSPDDHVAQVFGALGREAINPQRHDTPAPPAVNGVDPDAAREAVAAFHRTAGSSTA